MQHFRFTPNACSGPYPARTGESPRRDHKQTSNQQTLTKRQKSHVLPKAHVAQTIH